MSKLNGLKNGFIKGYRKGYIKGYQQGFDDGVKMGKSLFKPKLPEVNEKCEPERLNYLVSCLNICSLYGPDWMILLENIGLISMFITDCFIG